MAATTWNPSDKATDITLTNGNLTAVRGSGNNANWEIVRATNPRLAGKYYIELTLDALPSPNSPTSTPTGVGVANSSQSIAIGSFLGSTISSIGAFPCSGAYYLNASPANNWVPTATVGQVIGLAIDLDNGVVIPINATTVSNIGNPMVLGGTLMPGACFYASTAQVTANFGASSFVYPTPYGFAPGWDGVVPAVLTQWDPIRTYRSLGASGGNGFVISGMYNNIANGGGPGGGVFFGNVRATTFVSSGKYYCEFSIDSGLGSSGNGNWGCGVASATAAVSGSGNTYPGQDTNSFGYFPYSGQTYYNNSGSIIQTAAVGDVVCMALDKTNSKIWFRKNNGNWNNDVIANQNPATGAGGLAMSVSGAVGPAFATYAGQTTAQFGATGFTYPIPSGFSPWRSLVTGAAQAQVMVMA